MSGPFVLVHIVFIFDVQTAPVLAGATAGVLVVVGGLDHIVVIPCGETVVLKHSITIRQCAVSVDTAIENTVQYGHGFGTGNSLIGTEGPIGEPLDPSGTGSGGDVLVGPMTAVQIGETGCGAVVYTNEAHQHGDKLRTGDAVISTEVAVCIAVDVTAIRHGGYHIVIPLIMVHIVEAVGCGEDCISSIGIQQTEEDGCHLTAGYVVCGMR